MKQNRHTVTIAEQRRDLGWLALAEQRTMGFNLRRCALLFDGSTGGSCSPTQWLSRYISQWQDDVEEADAVGDECVALREEGGFEGFSQAEGAGQNDLGGVIVNTDQCRYDLGRRRTFFVLSGFK